MVTNAGFDSTQYHDTLNEEEWIPSLNDEPTSIRVDALSGWLHTAARHDILSREEEIELAKRIEQGDESAQEELIRANFRLVVSIAVQYQGRNVPLEDLIQEGNIGLMRAASKFDYHKGFKFSTYAIWWIKQSIMRALDNCSRSIRLPSYIVAKTSKFDSTYADLCQNLHREPTTDELAQALELPREGIEAILALNSDMLSLDTPLSDERGARTLGEQVEDSSETPESGPISELIEHELVAELLSKLRPREQEVLRMRYGLDDGEEKPLREVGDKMGITRERIRQLEVEALTRLRHLYDETGELR